jgi:hypothetical protein
MSASADNLRQALVERVSEPDMANHPSFEESPWPDAFCPVDDLIRYHKVPRSDLLLQATNS